MQKFTVEKIDVLNDKLNDQVITATGTINGDDFPFASLPNQITIILPTALEQTKIGVELDCEDNLIPVLSDEYGTYGSDGISGVLWYGKKENLDPIKNEVLLQFNSFIKNSIKDEIQEAEETLPPAILNWNFDDGTSLLFLYADNGYEYINTNIPGSGLISYHFGAHLDDVLADEVLYPFLAKELKKIKLDEDYEMVEEELEDLNDYTDQIKINDKKITPKDKPLVLNLAYHLLCTLKHWEEIDGSDEENAIKSYFAKKVFKNHEIEQLSNINGASQIKLVFSNDNSNKEYNINLTNNNGQWDVTVEYGRIGGNLKNEQKISTKNFEEAKEVYANLLKEKLAKGYAPEINVTKSKLKI